LLAFADDAIQRQELRRVASNPLSPRAAAPNELATQLVAIGASEWSTSFGEREEGLAAAAVPIRNHAGDVVAALSVSGPTARLSAERFELMCPEIKAAGYAISAALGWLGPIEDAGLSRAARVD
jgi:DNA-binding IclR family transcriptional regulator